MEKKEGGCAMERAYVAFISYRHATLDSAVAKQIHTLVEQYCIPRSLRRDGKKRLGLVFRDREELPISSDLSEDICRALDHAEHLIVVCSPNTKQSPWVTREIDYFLEHHDRSKVFTVLAAGEPGEVFPESLTQIVHADGTVTFTEPLALDARAGSLGAVKRKLRREILRLHAAMLGCPYDKLVLRAQRRRRQQITAVAAVVLAAALSFSGLLLVKNRQIEHKNRELEQQKQELLLRESELLTRDAWEALEQGNRTEAAANAATALQGAGTDRPYYAPAEAALIEAMGIFAPDWKDYAVLETKLLLDSAVADFILKADGAALAAADEFSTVTCFDTATGKKNWSRQVDTDGVEVMQLLACGQEALLCVRPGGVDALSWGDGGVLWSYENAFITENTGVLSDDGAYLAVLDWRLSGNLEKYEYYLLVLSTEDGREVSRLKLTEGAQFSATEALSYVRFEGVLGDFSDDNGAFAGVYTWEDVSKSTYITYYRADLADGTVQTVYTRTIDESNSGEVPVQVDFSKRECTVVFRQELSHKALTVETVDCHSCKRLWQLQTPEIDSLSDYDDPVFCLRWDKLLYLVREDMLYVLDLTDGMPVHYQSLGQEILAVEPTDDGLFVFLLADGTYTLGWHNDSGVYHSADVFHRALELGGGQRVLLWGESFLQLNREGDQYTGAATTHGGFAVALAEDDPTELLIRRVELLQDPSGRRVAAKLTEDDSLYEGGAVLLNEDTIAVGIVSHSVGEQTQNRALLLNGQREFLDLDYSWTMDQVMILPDGSGYLDWSSDLTVYDGRGGSTVLVQQEQVALSENEYAICVDDRWEYAVRRMPDGTVLAAACDGDVLRLWKNAQPWQEVQLPQELQFAVSTDIQYFRTLAISGEYVYFSHFEDAQDLSMDELAIYEIASEKWHRISCDGKYLSTVILAASSTGERFAMLDDTDTLRLCSVRDGEQCSVVLPVPQSAVMQLEFILDDTCLLLKTKDQQVLILDGTTGHTLFTARMDGNGLGSICAFADPVHNRLYLTDTSAASDPGLCLDMGSWTVLAEIPGLLCYDPVQERIFFYNRSTKTVLSSCLPSTQQLVDCWQQVME